MARAAAPQEIQVEGVTSRRRSKVIIKAGEIVALLNVCVQELDQLTAQLEKLSHTTSSEGKEEKEMLTRILGRQAGGSTTLFKELRALSEVMNTHDQRVISSRAQVTIAMIELRSRIRRHFYKTFEFLAQMDTNDSDSDEDVPQGRCGCVKW
ncbi:unnamed protein product [Calypogeia fissa]